jgi:hypothetical protein
VKLDARTARLGLGGVAIARCAVGVTALAAPGAVRLALGGSNPGTRTRVLTRFAGDRDLALGAAMLAALATGEGIGVVGWASVAVDLGDAVTSALAARQWPPRRWVPSAATAVAASAVGAILVRRAQRA